MSYRDNEPPFPEQLLESFEKAKDFGVAVVDGRSLQAYEQFLGKRSTLVLPADADRFRYLSSPQPQTDHTASARQAR